MFQAVPPPIIRSTHLYIQLQVLSTVMIGLNRLLKNLYKKAQEKKMYGLNLCASEIKK